MENCFLKGNNMKQAKICYFDRNHLFLFLIRITEHLIVKPRKTIYVNNIGNSYTKKQSL